MIKEKNIKTFSIGFQKTGTTTLETALIMLGYHVGRPEKSLVPHIKAGHWDPVWEIADQFTALQDNPWALLYKELDQHYPGGRFILTLRDPEKWVASMINHCGKKSNAMREWVYGKGHGSPVGCEQIYIDRLKRHNAEVIAYFKDRPDDLLIIDLTQGDGWEKLCPFLGVDTPAASFPHSNKRSYSPTSKFLKMVGIKYRHKAYRTKK